MVLGRREQALVGCEELDAEEPAGVIELEDDAVVCMLGDGRRDRLGDDGADIVIVSALGWLAPDGARTGPGNFRDHNY